MAGSGTGKRSKTRRNAQPAAVPADLVAWAGEVDVSRLSDKTVRDAEDYLNGYPHMNLDLSQQMGWRVSHPRPVEAQVTPSPPADAQPLDVIATVLALRRSSSALAYRHCRLAIMSRSAMLTTVSLSSVMKNPDNPTDPALPCRGWPASGPGRLRLALVF